MKVRIKKLHPDAVIPKYAKEGDAGLDLTAVEILITDDFIEYSTGISFEIPSGYVGLVFPRSSVSKMDLMLKNSVGVIDSSYRGCVKLRFQELMNVNLYKVGDKIGQLIIIPYPKIELEEVEELTETERGEKGFGSSGR